MRRRLKQQVGFTLIETLVVLMFLSCAALGAAQLTDSYIVNMRTLAAAQQMQTFGQAMQKYINDNYSTVASIATATNPALIRVSTLIGIGYLPTGFSLSNGYNQNICGLVLEPTPGQLTGLVVTEGGTVINDIDLDIIAGAITTGGGAGGAIYSTAPAAVTGSAGGWSIPFLNYGNTNNPGVNCSSVTGTVTIGLGHPAMALWFTGGDTTAGLLYRNVVNGQSQLNQMNTPITMSALEQVGATCTLPQQLGAIAQEGQYNTAAPPTLVGTGVLVTCQSSGQWNYQAPYWGSPVPNFPALQALGCSPTTIWQTHIVQVPTVPAIGGGPLAYTCDGSSWQPLAVDDSGNIKIAGIATISKMNGNLQVISSANDGASCSPEPDGSIAVSTATSGLILSCQTGVWKNGGATIANGVDSGTGLTNDYCFYNNGDASQNSVTFKRGVGGSVLGRFITPATGFDTNWQPVPFTVQDFGSHKISIAPVSGNVNVYGLLYSDNSGNTTWYCKAYVP